MSKMSKVEAAVKAVHADLKDTLGDVAEAWATTKKSVIRLLENMMGSSDSPSGSKAKGSTAKKAGKGKGTRTRTPDAEKPGLVAAWLKLREEGEGMSAALAAEKVGHSEQNLRNWEKALKKAPKAPKAAKKAKAEAAADAK